MIPEPLAVWLVRGLGLYVLVGLIFAVPFVWKGVGRIDHDARAGTRGVPDIDLPRSGRVLAAFAAATPVGFSEPAPGIQRPSHGSVPAVIRRLRVRHRYTVTMLAVVVPVVFVLAIMARVDPPASDLPPVLRTPTIPDHATEIEIAGVRFAAWPGDSSVHLVSVRSVAPFSPDDPRFGADVLVYWSPDGAAMDHEDAVLLGRFAGNTPVGFTPPARGGMLTYYSNAYRAVLASGSVPVID